MDAIHKNLIKIRLINTSRCGSNEIVADGKSFYSLEIPFKRYYL